MKLAFLENINFSSVLKRFPLPILFSTIIGVLSIMLVEDLIEKDSEAFRITVKLLHVLLLLFVSSALLSILRLSNSLVKNNFWFLAGGLFVAVLIYYFLLPKYPLQKHAIQTVGLVVMLHLFITVLPYWKNEDLKQYWAYNKILLLRFIEASLYTVFIFLSLSVALVALDKLFGISFRPLEIYGDLWVILLSFFHPLYFFSRFPKDLVFDNHELENSLPFRVFTRRILIPIVFLYGLILLAYVLKIITLWSWPRGWVSNMVLWFSVFGTLAYLLNYIQLEEKENRFVRAFKKYYFHFQALMSIVLMLAVYERIKTYGVTEARYIVASVGLWLFLISSYFVVSKRDNIKWIPASLALFIFIGTVGPLNMHNATIRSQFSRFMVELSEAGMLKDGVLQKAGELTSNLQIKLAQRMRVLGERNALSKLKTLTPNDLELPLDTMQSDRVVSPLHYNNYNHSGSEVRAYALALNIPYNDKFNSRTRLDNFSLYSPKMFSTSVGGYDRIVQLRSYKNNYNEQKETISLLDDGTALMYIDIDSSQHQVSLDNFLHKYDDQLIGNAETDSLVFETDTEKHHFKFILQNIAGSIKDGQYTFNAIDGIVLIKQLEK